MSTFATTYAVPAIESYTVDESIRSGQNRKMWTVNTADGPMIVCDFSKTNIFGRALEAGGQITFASYLEKVDGLELSPKVRTHYGALRASSKDPNYVSNVRFVNDQHRILGPMWVYSNGVQIVWIHFITIEWLVE